MAMVLLLLLCLHGMMCRSHAAFDSSFTCPCAASPASSEWPLTVAEAVRTSDVVLMGRIVDGTLQAGLRNTMNATLLAIYTYKGTRAFWTQVYGVTNFPAEASMERALFFLAKEPAGNLALRCMSQLTKLNEITSGDLHKLLEYVRIEGHNDNQENKDFVPPDPDPCLTHPCSPTGSFCSVINTPTDTDHKCTCLTGYHGDGYICTPIDLLPPSPPSPPSPPAVQCGGVGHPLVNLRGVAERCNERDILGDGCPHLHYCHHGICCPVTPPTSVEAQPSPSATISSTHSVAVVTSSSIVNRLLPTSSPSPSPSSSPDDGSGLERSGSGLEESGSGLTENDLDGSGSGLDESGSGLEESGSGLDDTFYGSGSGFDVIDLDTSGSGQPHDHVIAGHAISTVTRGSGEGGGQEHTIGQLDELETLYDDEDMAYGQEQLRKKRKRAREQR